MATFEKSAQSGAASVPATAPRASSMSLFGTVGNWNAWGWDGLHRIQFKASFTKNGQTTDKWNTYEVGTHRPYGNSSEENAFALKTTRYRHSPTGAVATFRKISGATRILRKLELSTHKTNYTCTCSGVQFKSKLLHNGTRSKASRPSRSMCYRPPLFFFSFVSLRFYSHKERCYILFKNHIIIFFNFLENPSIWNCVTWNCVSVGECLYRQISYTIRSTRQVRNSWLQGGTPKSDHSLSRAPNTIHRTSTTAMTPVRQHSPKNVSGHERALLNMNFKSVLRWRRQWRRSQLA